MDENKKYIEDICKDAKRASRVLSSLSTSEKNNILLKIAEDLKNSKSQIIEENKKDLEAGRAAGISNALYDRLLLNEDRIEGMANSIIEIASQEDPIGQISNVKTRPSGIRVGKMRVPVGVLAVIFESRPNVTTDIAAIAIKSGNSVILRGGKEAIHSNNVLYKIIEKSIKESGYDSSMVRFVENTDRALVPILLKMNKYIDIVVPRGGHKLIEMVSEESNIPVIKHDKGLCHVFVDESADKKMAEEIAINAKVHRPGVCNALETLLVHENYPYKKELLEALLAEKVELRGCAKTIEIIPDRIKAATEEDWDTEYLELILSIKIVDSMEAAMEHIYNHSSGHSESIITKDHMNAEVFLREVDSAAVFINASTRFHDGGEFGLGAEVGISTQKLHARGAMGVEGLTCEKFVVFGKGEIR